MLHGLETQIEGNVGLAWVVLLIAVAVLAKCADLFVESAVQLARQFNIPRLVIGIVLVSLATTAPELAVSLMAAIRGNPEMALGNAVGSVICDDGLGLPMVGFFAAGAVAIQPRAFGISAIVLAMVCLLSFGFVFQDYTLSRLEGAVLLAVFAGYLVFLFREHKLGRLQEELLENVEELVGRSVPLIVLLFIVGLLGIIAASEMIVVSASGIAIYFGIPKAVVALLLVALGTSIPEVATCVTAARKNEGAVAVGNILGADILNICWVAGASSLANPLTLRRKEIYFMFPAMFVIVGAMLIMLWRGYRLTRAKSVVLLALYLIYIVATFLLFPPEIHGATPQ